MNERITENIVRQHLETCLPDHEIGKAHYWEQTPGNDRIKKLLSKASKKGSGAGYPEFIITFDDYPDFLIVIECKASRTRHQSESHDRIADYAVDGVLHYASYLSAGFNVLAIAVSGTKESSLSISHFFCFQGNKQKPESAFGDELLPLRDYVKGYSDHPVVFRQDLDSLLQFTRELNRELHTLKIKETHRSLLISAILMALQDQHFVANYDAQPGEDLLVAIKNAMLKGMADTPDETFKCVKNSYGFMDVSGKLGDDRVLVDLVDKINKRVNSFRKTHQYYDVLGQLYIEFLRYSNSDKGLGIVLTPPHITELAADLVQVSKDDVLYDNCAGTGGFLISGMKRMMEQAKRNMMEEDRIKNKGIVGVEYQPDIASLLCTNMFIHGDGRSNVFQGDCFDQAVMDKVKNHFKPTVGLLNPPFKVEATDIEELDFVLNNLDALQPGGRCVALLPMQCALAQRGERLALKENLLTSHTLEAVLSLPNDLFHNSDVSAGTCLMVFTAGRPHPPNKETWFGYCKDDGYVKKKNVGRIDYYGHWEHIKEQWVSGYINRSSIPRFGIMRKVQAKDEWCAEAYIETDYTELTDKDFRKAERDFTIYKIKSEEYLDRSNKDIISLFKNWDWFSLESLFEITGTRTTPREILEKIGPGQYPYVTTQSQNNGVEGHYDYFTEEGGVITVDSAVIGFASWQPDNFSASDHVEKLIPKFPINSRIAFFLVTLLNADQFRYNYGRKASQTRLKKQQIRLPVDEKGAPDFAMMEHYVQSIS